MVPLEIRQLDLRYASLRIRDPIARGRLEAALSAEGQQVPVLVIAVPSDRFVLIEGYGRVAALERLGRDLVQAVVLDIGETEALVLRHRLESARRRTPLEEGWLVGVLLDLGQSQQDVALALGKSTAWVSRRLALVRILPDAVQDAVRAARIGSNAAEKFLVPLARGNPTQCEQLVAGLGRIRPSVRQLGRLYAAWRAGTAEVRARIATSPLLYLKVDDARNEPTADEDVSAIRDIEAVAGVLGKARKDVRSGAVVRLPAYRRLELVEAWKEVRLAFDGLARLMVQEGVDAR